MILKKYIFFKKTINHYCTSLPQTLGHRSILSLLKTGTKRKPLSFTEQKWDTSNTVHDPYRCQDGTHLQKSR